MLNLYTNKRFKARQEKRLDIFPGIGDESFAEYVERKFHFLSVRQSAAYFSTLEKDPYAGICEVVYGVKYIPRLQRNGYQKLFVIPEKHTVPLIRNAYYNWGGMAQGFYSYGYDGKKGANNGLPFMPDYDWIDPVFPLERVYWSEDLITAERMMELDPSLKWCAFKPNSLIRAIEYIRLYRNHPQVCEMLMKMSLFRFVNEKTVEMLEGNRHFAYWVARNAESIRTEYMAPQTAFNAYKKNPNADPADYAKSLAYRIECGRAIAFDNRKVYDKALEYTTQERLAEYIRDNHINNRSYGDYLIAADWLRLDFADTKVLFPRNFHEVHDSYTEQYGAYCHAQELAEQRERERKNREEIASRAERMKQVADRFAFLGSYKAEGFCVIVAATKDELIDEGIALSHCVGRMDYDKRQAEGRSVICFIRHDNDRHTPFVTAEVKITDQQLKVVQCYGDHDRVVPEVAGFTAGWMTSANEAYSEKRRKMA